VELEKESFADEKIREKWKKRKGLIAANRKRPLECNPIALSSGTHTEDSWEDMTVKSSG
jgi:hypothetical protein